MNIRWVIAVFVFSILFWSCQKDKGNPVEAMNAGLQLPAGSYQVDPDTMKVDNTITINPGSGGIMPIHTGTQLNAQISFNAPLGNVVAGGMRFGNSGPINVVPVQGAQGQTSGILNLPLGVSAGTCNNLSQVCHDIKCYEFAITADGKISQANIRDVALMCGGCNEPSCASLIDPPCPPGQGKGSFNFSLGSGSGDAVCAGGLVGISSALWTIVASNVGSAGSFNFTSDYYYNGCTLCPALQITKNNTGESFVAIGGTGKWSGDVFTFTANMKDVIDLGGGGPVYTLGGSVKCK